MKVRIKFRKYGVMKFIGHLDIMRYFQKAIRRAGIPIAYTEGFSPHQIMSFAAPLGVGLCSNGEYLDIECRDPVSMTASEMKDKLNQAMAEGVDIVSVRALPKDAGNAMASVAAARYTITFREGCQPDFDWNSQLNLFYEKSDIIVTKKTKKQLLELNIKPAIYELFSKEEDGQPAIEMLVDASSAGNIKPGLVLQAFYEFCGRPVPSDMAFLITREDTYGIPAIKTSDTKTDETETGKAQTIESDGEPQTRFIPLVDFGEDF